MSKPIDLIAANVIHEMATLLELPRNSLLSMAIEGKDDAAIANDIMRALLMTFAKDGSVASIRKALLAIGSPSEPAEIMARVTAAREQIREMDGTAQPTGETAQQEHQQ